MSIMPDLHGCSGMVSPNEKAANERRHATDIELNNSQSENDDEEEDPFDQFAEVMQVLRDKDIPEFAVQVRKRCAEEYSEPLTRAIEPARIILPPLSGSFHVLYPITFHDGVRWLLKIPGTGTGEKWDTSAARSLTSEALTMRFLRRETTVPVPDVFDYSSECQTALGVPFILMEYVDGSPLMDSWFDITASAEDLRSRRTHILRDIASAMSQLARYTFERGGSIIFGDCGRPSSIGPMRVIDNYAVFARLDSDDEDRSLSYAEAGPFDDCRSYFTAGLARRPAPNADWQKGDSALLQLFLECIPEPETSNRTAFVLTHPDIDMQNVLVSQDGHLKALIDRDGVCAVPTIVGSERYPSWLTRDWDPAMYGYEEGMETDLDPQRCREDSPDTLALYRGIYACLMEKRGSSDADDGSDKLAKSSQGTSSVTRQSLIFENLHIAVEDPLCTHGILTNLFAKIKLTCRKGRLKDLEYWDVTQSIAQAQDQDGLEDALRAGFHALLADQEGLI